MAHSSPLLTIENLSVGIENKEILHNVNLTVQPGSVHALMGSNGSGKSTLAATLMGHSLYKVLNGTVYFNGYDLFSLSPDKRAQAGIFLSFQHPIEVPGVSVFAFLKEAYRACTTIDISVAEFKSKLEQALATVGLDPSFAYRHLNEGFSGGEKKRLEIVQLLILQPKLAILDEIDSGLDIDALKAVAQALEVLRNNNPLLSIIIITHYKRMLEYIIPDCVHVIKHGTIVHSGTSNIVERIEKHGYDQWSQVL